MRFEKVSFKRFLHDYAYALDLDPDCCDLSEEFIETARRRYDAIKLPKRATSGSAGYDFFIPYKQKFNHKIATLIPTGIRFNCDPDKYLPIYPRSGLGFKYGMALRNTVGIIDHDYYFSDNEGHIMLKVICDEDFELEAGKGIAQGIISNYYKVEDDSTDGERNGGFGSTGM